MLGRFYHKWRRLLQVYFSSLAEVVKQNLGIDRAKARFNARMDDDQQNLTINCCGMHLTTKLKRARLLQRFDRSTDRCYNLG